MNETVGTPDLKADLARQISVQSERDLRGLTQQKVMRQTRTGDILRLNDIATGEGKRARSATDRRRTWS